MIMKSPFKNGKSGVQKILHSSFKLKETSIRVRVRRGSDEFAELQACIVPGDQFLGKKQYVLRAIDDPNYAVGFFDRTESECFNLQGKIILDILIAVLVDFSFSSQLLCWLTYLYEWMNVNKERGKEESQSTTLWNLGFWQISMRKELLDDALFFF